MLESAKMFPDLIVINGAIRTMDDTLPRATAFVSRAGELVFVGGDEGALGMRTRSSEVLDARGRLVLPGFTDSHIHFTGFAQSLSRVNLDGCGSLQEAVARVKARVLGVGKGVTIYGWGWNQLDWQVPNLPDKTSLDLIAPQNPVILTRKDGHSAWVNSAALSLSGITNQTPDPDGGKLERGASGEPTGLVRENALDLLGRGIGKDDEEISQSELIEGIQIAHRAGITAIHNIEGPNALRAWQTLRDRGELNLRVVHSIPAESLDSALALGLKRRFGDDWLRLQSVKIFADGSLGSQTAEMSEPYVGTDKTGMALTDDDTLLTVAGKAARGGLDVWIHAIGDKAISRSLDVFQVLRREGLETIFRIEHVQHLMPKDLPRFEQLQVIASMQPIHQPSDMKMADQMLGPERARYTYAFNSLRNAGATLAFGSDCPVENLAPLRGIHAAVTRQNEKAEPPEGWFPEERLSVEQAVSGFTLGAAAACGDGRRSGKLAPGYHADAVILSHDIFMTSPHEIIDTQVDYTIVGGQIVYRREN